jgi:hypothetical protein
MYIYNLVINMEVLKIWWDTNFVKDILDPDLGAEQTDLKTEYNKHTDTKNKKNIQWTISSIG